MLPGWSGSGPQIRGPGPVTQWALGRACSHGLLQTANHRHESLPGTGTVCTEIVPRMHSPNDGDELQGASVPLAGCHPHAPSRKMPGRAGEIEARPPLGLTT